MRQENGKMKILIFGGTVEAHRLSDTLCDRGMEHTVCVATQYGEQVLEDREVRTVLTGRLDIQDMSDLMRRDGFGIVIDATHPYATQVSANIAQAAELAGVELYRLLRPCDEHTDASSSFEKNADIFEYDDIHVMAKALRTEEGNILLTTGSKELNAFTDTFGAQAKERVYVRIIPGTESLKLCEEAGIPMSHVIAMQGPFTKEMNKAIIGQYNIRHLVSKESGSAGGFDEKKEAAGECGIRLHLLKRPSENKSVRGLGYDEVLRLLTGGDEAIHLSLVGTGMGDSRDLTLEGYEVICKADVILGAKRLICRCDTWMNDAAGMSNATVPKRSKPYEDIYTPKAVVEYIKDHKELSGKSVAVLFSGDSGCYSGCKGVYEALRREKEDGLNVTLRIIPGISSVSYMAALIGRPYDAASILSTHGKGQESIYKAAAHIRVNSDTYILTSGIRDIKKLAEVLTDAGMGEYVITLAFDMSFKTQKMMSFKACDSAKQEFVSESDLCTCHVYDPDPVKAYVTAGYAADEFIRGAVPMTKEEVRTVTLAKLKLGSDSVMFDIGCGTGSVSIEAAALMREGMVYAFDKKEAAVVLTRQNAVKHRLPNVTVSQGEAPEILPEGIVPTHAFIGGNEGRLTDILDRLRDINPGIRIVINAITDRTKETIASWLKNRKVTDVSVIRMQVSRIGCGGSDDAEEETVTENAVNIYSFTMDGQSRR